MTFSYRRKYMGPVRALILDWSGTTVDFGCFAPTIVFVEIFKAEGIEITLAEARAPMGLYKRDHIVQILQMSRVAEQWMKIHNRPATQNDVDRMYKAFIPRQMETIVQYTDPIPGVVDTLTALRKAGLKIGSSTGYTRAMMEKLVPEARNRGYEPDSLVCPDDVPAGRPAPWMCYQNAMNLGVYPLESIVKIGDTLPDIAEGLNAGMWTIGVAKTGNELGLNEAEIAALDPAELKSRLASVYEKLYQAGAHYVVDSLADILPIIDQINEKLSRAKHP
jgi:phosphonoacetaldehyde hydrolase